MVKDIDMAQDNFEDQVRRMMTANGAAQPSPVVRLPPNPQQPPPYAVQHPSYARGGQFASPQAPNPFPGHQQAPSNSNYTHYSQSRYAQHPNDHFQGRNAALPQHNGHMQHPHAASQQRNMPSQQHGGFQQSQYRPAQSHNRPSQQYNQMPPQRNGQGNQYRGNQQVIDPNQFRGRVNHNGAGPQRLYTPKFRPVPGMPLTSLDLKAVDYLNDVASKVLPEIHMSDEERSKKMAFQARLDSIVQQVCHQSQGQLPTVSLECFGSFKSGFSGAGSDMDLVLVPSHSGANDASPTSGLTLHENDLPRLLEQALLDSGIGARLLTRTRVPILKVCSRPSIKRLHDLREERAWWDQLPEDQKYSDETQVTAEREALQAEAQTVAFDDPNPLDSSEPVNGSNTTGEVELEVDQMAQQPTGDIGVSEPKPARTRLRKPGRLDFTADDGIHCDINFTNPLGLHNTQLLHNYSLIDARVKPMVLFVKHWAKLRHINSSYAGTLSSYGYVLMVLHYLMNVAQPPVIPNLQGDYRPPGNYSSPGASKTVVDGCVVDFWSNEQEIRRAVEQGHMRSENTDSLGVLLRGFFYYFGVEGRGAFHWVNNVLSLRTEGGILSKTDKGWTHSNTRDVGQNKVYSSHLLCIEDPFELDHNVARTVRVWGKDSIRYEFNRAVIKIYDHGNRDVGSIHLLVEPLDSEMDLGPKRPNRGNGSDRHRREFKVQAVVDPNKIDLDMTTPPLPTPEDFPALGATTTSTQVRNAAQKKANNKSNHNPNFSEVSGERAQQVLQKFQEEKMKQHAENLATGTAEAVLDGFD